MIRRIYVSMPADEWLTSAQNEMKWGVVERIERLKYTPEIFTDPTGRKSLSAGIAWSAANADEIARHCCGAAIIGLPRGTFKERRSWVNIPTEFNHYEGALARTLGLPMLILAQQNLSRRVVFDYSFGPTIGTFPPGADKRWLDTPAFQVCFSQWEDLLKWRRDVFLGYCGGAAKKAEKLRAFLEDELDVSVLDWKRDFTPGRSILEEIEEACSRCTAGIFLFSNDDDVVNPEGEREAAPRDNVVFEAGYFASTKGKQRVLIVREEGTRMPADLGGDIYATLGKGKGKSLSDVKNSIRKFTLKI